MIKKPIINTDLKLFFEMDKASLFKHGDRMYKIIYMVMNQYFLLKMGTKKVKS